MHSNIVRQGGFFRLAPSPPPPPSPLPRPPPLPSPSGHSLERINAAAAWLNLRIISTKVLLCMTHFSLVILFLSIL